MRRRAGSKGFPEPSSSDMITRLISVLMLLSFAALAWSAETGIAARDLDLRADPRNDAKIVGKLQKDGRFELLKYEKFWAQVSAGNRQGWVMSFYLSMGAEPAANPSPGRVVAESLGLVTRRQGGQATAVLGIRGIDEEQLKAARFNAEELKKLESFLVTRPTATVFAREIPLGPVKVDYLRAPVPENTGGEPGGGR